ncbi:bifunctional DNA-binding transcriptional repressor/ NMN adenylyltransferase [compost metagenome]
MASEQYGYKLAEILECKYYQYDIQRQILSTKSTDVRNNIIDRFNEVLPYFQPYLQTKITLYGAESCGKTTTSKYLTNHLLEGYYLPEWARPYLESLSNPLVTEELMDDITEGQMALQMHSNYSLTDKPFIVQDTDLLSTIGYYKIMGLEVPQKIIDYFKQSKSDIYFLMASNIPFEPDPLRYGGEVRESDDDFWIRLLNEYECNYYIVNQDSLEARAEYIKDKTYRYVDDKFSNIKDFVRD